MWWITMPILASFCDKKQNKMEYFTFTFNNQYSTSFIIYIHEHNQTPESLPLLHHPHQGQYLLHPI